MHKWDFLAIEIILPSAFASDLNNNTDIGELTVGMSVEHYRQHLKEFSLTFPRPYNAFREFIGKCEGVYAQDEDLKNLSKEQIDYTLHKILDEQVHAGLECKRLYLGFQG